MELAIRALYFVGMSAAFFHVAGSLHASTFQSDDNPLQQIESSFFSESAATDQGSLATQLNVPALGIPSNELGFYYGGQADSVSLPLVSESFGPRRIPASLTNWSDEAPTVIPDYGIGVQEPLPEPTANPSEIYAEEPFEENQGGPFALYPTLHGEYQHQAIERPRLIGRRPFRKFLRRNLQADYGLGYERITFAPLVLDTATTSSYMGIRVRSDRGINAPDRLEYLWGKAGNGPSPESRVDLIDTIFRTEIGNEKAGFISEMRMRSLDPTVNGNTLGFGDMLVGGKVLVYDTACTKVSTIFLTHLNTGPERKGLGRGHVALEPGVLATRKWNDRTYLFGEWKYHLPLGATRGFAGDVFKTGWGVATIWHDTDRYAMIPTFEVQTHSFLFGGRTLPNGSEVRVDGTTAVDLYPGVRWTFSKTSMGACELGMAGGVSFADRDWFDSRMIFEMRWLR